MSSWLQKKILPWIRIPGRGGWSGAAPKRERRVRCVLPGESKDLNLWIQPRAEAPRRTIYLSSRGWNGFPSRSRSPASDRVRTSNLFRMLWTCFLTVASRSERARDVLVGCASA
jgi:hypothetical protein